MKINIMYFKECNLILPLWRFTLFHTAGVTSIITRRGDTWNMHITHPDGSVNRIKMDWSNTQGPVLI